MDLIGMRQLPPLYALRAFEMAARLGSFTKAANQLCVSQSAVSHHVKNLESYFGCKLFRRNGKMLCLTTKGEDLSNDLRDAFLILEKACFNDIENQAPLRIKTPTSLTARWLLLVTSEYNKNPAASPVQINSCWMEFDKVDFYSEPYDGAILLSDGSFPDHVEPTKIFDEWLVPVCSPGFKEMHDMDMATLHNLPLLHPSQDRRDWSRWLRGVGIVDKIEAKGGMVFDTVDQGITAASQGLGISIGDLAMVSKEVEMNNLVMPFPYAVYSGSGYYFVRPKYSSKQHGLELFLEFLISRVPSTSWKELVCIR